MFLSSGSFSDLIFSVFCLDVLFKGNSNVFIFCLFFFLMWGSVVCVVFVFWCFTWQGILPCLFFFVDVFPCFDFFSNLLVAGLYLVLFWCSLVLFIDFCFWGKCSSLILFISFFDYLLYVSFFVLCLLLLLVFRSVLRGSLSSVSFIL